jgi:hypothetical protein
VDPPARPADNAASVSLPEFATPVAQAPVVQPVEFTPPMFSTAGNLNGIGGWLILVALGLAVSPFLILRVVFADFRILNSIQFQTALDLHPGLASLVLFEAITDTLFIVAAIGLNILLYRKKKAFPTCMVIYFAAQIVWVLTDHLLAMRFNSHSAWTGFTRAVIAALIWIPYFLRSERVRDTFVN